MPKRRAGTSSSSNGESSDTDDRSHSSIDDPSFTPGSGGATMKKSRQQPLAKESRKKSRNCSAVSEPREQSPVASTSTQLQRDLGIIVKGESEESEVEHTELTDSPPQLMSVSCSSSAGGGQQPQPNLRRSERKRVASKVWTAKDPKQGPSSKKAEAPVPKLDKRYFEGVLVMAEGENEDDPDDAGMIRIPTPEEDKHPSYICVQFNDFFNRLVTFFFVQLFCNPTKCVWREAKGLRVFKADKPNRCYHPDPDIVRKFAIGVKIAKAAANFSVGDRLRKFTLTKGAPIDGLLMDIDEWNDLPAPRDDSIVHNEDEPYLPQGNGQLNSHDSGEDEPAPQAQRDGRISPELVDFNIMKKRVSDYHQKLRDECSREKDEEIKRLKTDKSNLAEEKHKLEATVEEQAKEIAELREKQEKEKLEHKKKVEKEKLEHKKKVEKEKLEHKKKVEKEKLEHKKELEKEKQEKLKYKKAYEEIKGVFDDMIGDSETQP